MEEYIGRLVSQEVARRVAEALQGYALAVTAKVATTAQKGSSPFRNFVSPNGDTITNGEVAIYLMVNAPDTTNYTWCPVRRGLTLAEGDTVRVVRDSLSSTTWWIDAKL